MDMNNKLLPIKQRSLDPFKKDEEKQDPPPEEEDVITTMIEEKGDTFLSEINVLLLAPCYTFPGRSFLSPLVSTAKVMLFAPFCSPE